MSSVLPEHLQPTFQSRNGLFASYPANHVGRDFVVGDIHGHFNRLQTVLDEVGFDGEKDRLFATGDLVDRGPESILAFRWTSQPWFISTMGNHEQWCIESSAAGHPDRTHLAHGGAWFYDIPESARIAYAKVFLKLPIAIEFLHADAGLVGVVHAECPFPDWDVFQAALVGGLEDAADDAMWLRKRITEGDSSLVGSIDRIYAGHSIVSEVIALGNTHYVDTGCGFADGRLTLVQVS